MAACWIGVGVRQALSLKASKRAGDRPREENDIRVEFSRLPQWLAKSEDNHAFSTH